MSSHAAGARAPSPFTHRLSWLRTIALAAGAVAGLTMAGSQAAWASAGCTALNGSYSQAAGVTGNLHGAGFNAGDVITVTITTAASGQVALYDATASRFLIPWFASGSASYTVPATTADTFEIG